MPPSVLSSYIKFIVRLLSLNCLKTKCFSILLRQIHICTIWEVSDSSRMHSKTRRKCHQSHCRSRDIFWRILRVLCVYWQSILWKENLCDNEQFEQFIGFWRKLSRWYIMIVEIEDSLRLSIRNKTYLIQILHVLH
jgi:hypothetical protein